MSQVREVWLQGRDQGACLDVEEVQQPLVLCLGGELSLSYVYHTAANTILAHFTTYMHEYTCISLDCYVDEILHQAPCKLLNPHYYMLT